MHYITFIAIAMLLIQNVIDQYQIEVHEDRLDIIEQQMENS